MDNAIGKAIKVCRVQRDMNQTELATLANISTSYLSLLERGKRDATVSTIKAIADALDIPLVILIYIAGGSNHLGISNELREKLAYESLQFLNNKDDKNE